MGTLPTWFWNGLGNWEHWIWKDYFPLSVISNHNCIYIYGESTLNAVVEAVNWDTSGAHKLSILIKEEGVKHSPFLRGHNWMLLAHRP